jgi:hypothetical protein
MAVALLKLPESGWVKATERALQLQHVVSGAPVVRSSLIASGYLQRLLLLIRNECKEQLQSGVLRHLYAVVVQQATLSNPLRHPQTDGAFIVPGL